MTSKKKAVSKAKSTLPADYEPLLSDVAKLLETARRSVARSVNSIMTATYWLIGYRIVEQEQKGKARAEYGKVMLKQLSSDLSDKFGRGFSERSLYRMRAFCQAWPILPTALAKSSKDELLAEISKNFPLPWVHYIRLISVKKTEARTFYEEEALRNGWSIRQLERQIGTQFYERVLLSKNKAAMLEKAGTRKKGDILTPDEEIKDPYVLEFLNLKDEYSENELEEALIRHLETFLLELGGDFAFVGRQKRLRIDDEWFRIDLVFYHRRLRCLVLIDLKLDKFKAEYAGKMNMYVNYAWENWTLPEENPPVGIVLCSEPSGKSQARYALTGLTNKVLAAEYKTALPDEKLLTGELAKTRKILEGKEIALEPLKEK